MNPISSNPQDETLETITGFPSDFVSPTVKESKEYCLKWAKAMERVGLHGTNNGLFPGFAENNSRLSRFALWRSYARAKQPIDKYKPILGVRNKTRKDPGATSYRVLNWEIMDVATKYVNVLVGRLIKQNNDIGVRAIDKRAEDDRLKKKVELQVEIINRKFYDSITQSTGIQFPGPDDNGVVPVPEQLGQVDLFMDMFYKEKYCAVVQDLMKSINEQNNYTEILAGVARDFVEIGCAVTKVYRAGEKIMERQCQPERMGVSSSLKPNFEDVKWIYEDWDLTIGQLKEIAGDQLSEKQYRDIAEKASASTFDSIDVSEYYKQNFCYPWDSTKITVKDCVWFSPDWMTEQIAENSYGNMEVQQKDYDWWEKLSKKGVTVESFNEANKSQVVRYALDNQYQCLWIKNTDYVVNYGKSKDMLKNKSSIGRTIGPYTIYQLRKCPIETIIPTLDNIQIQWLQYQHHAAKSVPAGQAIEFTALQDINLEGKGGTNLSPKEALQIYFDTGILLWRRRDAAGNLSNYMPIQELAGGISNAMEKHFSYIIQNLNLLRDQLGLNELTDASTPNSEMGKAVASMATEGTNDALRPLHFAFDQMNLGTQLRVVMNISGMANTGMAPYVHTIGLSGVSIMQALSEVTNHELGVYLMKQPTQEMRMWINQICDTGIKSGTLYEEEAIEILNEPNIYRCVQLLKMYRNKKIQQKQEQEAGLYQAKAQADAMSAQVATQNEMAKEDKRAEVETGIAWEQARAQAWLNKQKASDEAFLLSIKNKLETQKELTIGEQERMTELMKVSEQGAWQMRAAAAKPKPSPGRALKK